MMSRPHKAHNLNSARYGRWPKATLPRRLSARSREGFNVDTGSGVPCLVFIMMHMRSLPYSPPFWKRKRLRVHDAERFWVTISLWSHHQTVGQNFDCPIVFELKEQVTYIF
jgi:hypothetical protein